MDIDAEVDSKLAQQFGCITTADRETLIRNFRRILNSNVVDAAANSSTTTNNSNNVAALDNNALMDNNNCCDKINDGNHPKEMSHHHCSKGDDVLNKETCAFFLDMNNWNLPAALGSFYDFNVSYEMLRTPNMTFVEDVTIGEGDSVSPSTTFVKTWRLKNSGSFRWPDGCALYKCTEDSFLDVCLRFENRRIEVPCRVEPGQTVDLSVRVTSPSCVGIFQSMWRLMTSTGVPFGDYIWCILSVENAGVLDITQKLAATHVDKNETSNCSDNLKRKCFLDGYAIESVQTDGNHNTEQIEDSLNNMEN